jgi:membrane associated rhomboid family serine protease
MEQYLTLAPVASVIFALTILISLVAFSNDTIFEKFILHPYEVAKGKKLYTLITSGFIHNDYMHLFFNMLSYFFFAFQLEATIGHWQFALLYIVSMVLSDLPSVAKHKDDFWYRSLGASGAISAVIFGYILYQPLASMMLLILPIPIPAVLFGILYLIYCTYASKRGQDNINHDAHLFGALSGIMITAILDHSALPTFVHAITEKVQSLLH